MIAERATLKNAILPQMLEDGIQMRVRVYFSAVGLAFFEAFTVTWVDRIVDWLLNQSVRVLQALFVKNLTIGVQILLEKAKSMEYLQNAQPGRERMCVVTTFEFGLATLWNVVEKRRPLQDIDLFVWVAGQSSVDPY